MIAAPEASELTRCVADDGKEYSVIPTMWTRDLLKEVWKRRRQFHTMSDDVPDHFAGFVKYVMDVDAIWFSIICVEDREVVGMMYVTGLTKSWTQDRIIDGVWHCELWDSKAGKRLTLLRNAILGLFRTLGLHRLQCEIPVKFGGAIRIAKKIGFIPDGRLRAARRYNDQWFDVLTMSLLEDEVAQWAR